PSCPEIGYYHLPPPFGQRARLALQIHEPGVRQCIGFCVQAASASECNKHTRGESCPANHSCHQQITSARIHPVAPPLRSLPPARRARLRGPRSRASARVVRRASRKLKVSAEYPPIAAPEPRPRGRDLRNNGSLREWRSVSGDRSAWV